MATSNLVLNEIYPTPTSDEVEWLEIYNPSETSIDLAGWQIAELTSGIIKNYQKLVTASFFLAPHSHFLWENDQGAKITFNNNGDTIYLFNPQEELIDETTYPVLGKGKSWARLPDGGDNDSWQIASSITAGAANPLPIEEQIIVTEPVSSPIDASQSAAISSPTIIRLQLSEFMTCPETGQPEWVEIYNQSEQAVTLNNWKIFNQKENSRTLSETQLAAGQYTVIEFASGLLSNSGGTLVIKNSLDEEIMTADFEDCNHAKGQSWIFDGDKWQLTNQTTPRAPNIYSTNKTSSAQISGGNNITTTAKNIPDITNSSTLINHNTSSLTSAPQLASQQLKHQKKVDFSITDNQNYLSSQFSSDIIQNLNSHQAPITATQSANLSSPMIPPNLSFLCGIVFVFAGAVAVFCLKPSRRTKLLAHYASFRRHRHRPKIDIADLY